MEQKKIENFDIKVTLIKDLSESAIQEVSKQIKTILWENLGEAYKTDPAFSEEQINKWFDQDKSILCIFKNGPEVVGYVVAVDDESLGEFKSEFEEHKDKINNLVQNPKVLYLYSADIKNEFQRQNLVWEAGKFIIQEAKKRGYDYIVTDTTGEGFTKKFSEVLKNAIVVKQSKESEYGPQTFYVVDMNKLS